MKKKHFLAIFILAFFVMGLSSFYKNRIFGNVFAHGLPFEFLRTSEWVGRTKFFWKPKELLFDIFFWFLFFAAPYFSIFLKGIKWLRISILFLSSIFLSVGINVILEKFAEHLGFVYRLVYYIPEVIRESNGLGNFVPPDFFEVFGLFLNKVLAVPVIFVLLFLFPSFWEYFIRLIHKSKIYWKYISIGLILIILLGGAILSYYWREKAPPSPPPPPTGEASEIIRIKILKIHGSGFAGITEKEFYEINFIDGEYKEKNGVTVPREYINQLKESLLDKVETQGFYSAQKITDVFSYQMVEILWGNKERTILRSTSVGIPWWNILEEGWIYFQNSGAIPQSLNKIITTIKREETSKETEEPKFTELPPDLGKGEIPPEIEKGYLGFTEFQNISWKAYLYPQPTFSITLNKNIDLEIKKAVLQVNKKLYSLEIQSYKDEIILATTLKDITDKPTSKFKGEITIWYKRNGIEYITDGIVNGIWWKDPLTLSLPEPKQEIPKIAYKSERWILEFKPVVKESPPTRAGKAKITFQKPQGEIKKILLIDGDCSLILVFEKEGLTQPCNIISEDDQTITIFCDLEGIAGIHEPGEEIELCLGIRTNGVLEMSQLKGVWLAEFSESMDKYLKIYYAIAVSPGFEIQESKWEGDELEVILKTNKEIEILRIEKGYSNKKEVKAGEVFTLHIKDLQDSDFRNFDDTFYPQTGTIEFIYRDSKEHFAYPGRIFISKYAIKK